MPTSRGYIFPNELMRVLGRSWLPVTQEPTMLAADRATCESTLLNSIVMGLGFSVMGVLCLVETGEVGIVPVLQPIPQRKHIVLLQVA